MEMDLVSKAMLTWKIVLSEQQMIQHMLVEREWKDLWYGMTVIGNGSSFVLSHIGSENINSHPVIVEDSTVIYARSHFGAGKEIVKQSREFR